MLNHIEQIAISEKLIAQPSSNQTLIFLLLMKQSIKSHRFTKQVPNSIESKYFGNPSQHKYSIINEY